MNFRSALDFHQNTMHSIVHASHKHRTIFYAVVSALCIVLFSSAVRSENISQAKKVLGKIIHKMT